MIELEKLITQIMVSKGHPVPEHLNDGLDLRDDLGLDSLDLAELTVKIEAETGIDIFEDGFVRTIGEIREKLRK